MLESRYFGSFYPVNSSIHRLNPVIKLICLFMILIPMTGSMDIKLHIVIFFFIIMLMYTSNVPMKFYFNMLYGLRYIYIILLFLLASKGLSLEQAVVIFIKISTFIEYLSLIFYTTSPSELKYGIEKTLNPFNLFNFNLGRLSNKIVGIINFFPLLFTTEHEVLKSAAARGLDYYHSDILAKINVVLSSFKNTLRLTFEKIHNIKFASELRMYSVTKFRTNLRTNKVGFFDIMLILVHLIFIMSYIKEVGLIWNI